MDRSAAGVAMILGRAILHRSCRETWKWADDANLLHGAIWKLFPGVKEQPGGLAAIGLLHRLEVDRDRGRVLLYVQADRAPAWENWPQATYGEPPESRSTEAFHAGIAVGDRLRFRLRGSPVARRTVAAEEAAPPADNWMPPATEAPTPGSGKLRIRERSLHGADAVAWLVRQGAGDARLAGHGFRVSRDVLARELAIGAPSRRVRFHAVTFDGVLEVTDLERFRGALARGVGRGKAFGMGLLTVARLP